MDTTQHLISPETPSGDDLSPVEQQAFGLSRAALMIDEARESHSDDAVRLLTALNHNLEIWIAIRTWVMNPDCILPQRIRNNLLRLSRFVADRTFESADGVSEQTLNTLININLQISEGLLEGGALKTDSKA